MWTIPNGRRSRRTSIGDRGCRILSCAPRSQLPKAGTRLSQQLCTCHWGNPAISAIRKPWRTSTAVPYAACDRHHQEILLTADWSDGNPHCWRCTAGPVLAALPRTTRSRNSTCDHVRSSRSTSRRVTSLFCRALHWRPFKIWTRTTRARHGLLNALQEAFIVLDTRDPLDCDTFYESVQPAMQALQSGVAASGAPLDAVIHATGHAHIDVAWLWTLGQTRRKSERTFQNVIRLMEQFPDYHFSQSQPQVYQFVKEDQPELFECHQATRLRMGAGNHWAGCGSRRTAT